MRDRLTDAALNKDRVLIDPATGAATAPTTPRGQVEDNFAKAVAGAVAETRRQWRDFRSELTDRSAKERAEMMLCALTHDDPVNDCPDRRSLPSSASCSSQSSAMRRSPR